MKSRITFYLTIATAIVTFDMVTALVSKSFHIDYVNFIYGSWTIYAASGYFACRYFTFPEGILGGALAGLSDSTIGWAVSLLIGPYLSEEMPKLSPVLIAFTIIVVTGIAAFLGLLGALLNVLITRLGYGRVGKR